MFSGTVTGKRVGEEISIGEQPPSKKAKAEKERNLSDEGSIGRTYPLPYDLLGRIALFLPARELCIFESVFRGVGPAMNAAWEELAKRERLDFDWSLSERDRTWYPKKARYLHAKILSVYISASRKLGYIANPMGIRVWIPPTPQQVKECFKRFKGIMKRYPSTLGAFIWQYLNDLTKINSRSSHLFQKEIVANSSPKTAGDFLLKGLSYLSLSFNSPLYSVENTKHRQLGFESLNQAILKGASCASYLAIQIGLSRSFGLLDNFYFQLATISVFKGDYRGLEMLLEENDMLVYSLYSHGISYPPILAQMARISTQVQEKESLFDRAIEGYQNSPIPAWVWQKAGKIKNHLKKFQEAEKYHTAAVAAYGDKVPAGVLNNLAWAKLNLGKNEEAEGDYTAAIQTYESAEESVPWFTLGRLAQIKKNLKKYKEAVEYYLQAIAVCADEKIDVCVWIWQGLGDIKNELGQWEEAEDYLIKAKNACEDKVPAIIWNNLAWAKLNLKKYKEAEEDYTAAIQVYESCNGGQVPWYTLGRLAQVKKYLEKYKEAVEYYNRAILARANEKIDVPAWVWGDLGYVKNQLGNWEEVEDCLIKAKNAYGDQVPASLLNNLARTKFALEEWEEAEEGYMACIKAFKSQPEAKVPWYVLKRLAQVKKQLEKYNEAVEYYTQSVTACANDKRDVEVEVWEDLGFVNLKLDRWEEAEKSYTQAIASYGNNVPDEVWYHLATAKKKLNKWEEAKECIRKQTKFKLSPESC